MRAQRPAAKSSDPASPDVLGHLAQSLRVFWRRYCKRLKCCQESFSEEAVHDFRVQARRLLASVELLRAFVPEKDLRKARRALKEHLDTFDRLRDTQVQLVYVRRLGSGFPQARRFLNWLSDREGRFSKRTRKAVKKLRTHQLGRRICRFEKEIERQRRQTPRAGAYARALRAIDRAFRQVAQSCKRVDPGNSATIHRTRIAFKRFRYMVEAMSPLLPAFSEEQRVAMHGYQSMMGDIQDLEVLAAAFDKFAGRHRVDGRAARKLPLELQRRRRWLIQVYVNAAGKLRQFWPQPGLSPSGKTRSAGRGLPARRS